ncbi:MAG: nicotinate-nucleotide adenylyltransferase [Erysipelotrichia bacterium]|nr:nicotinate-nucleotide adenylyltransferase [Erysipelotrichia bacterium]
MNRIIFCGGFDPIHLGHINMAIQAQKILQGEVIFVPAKIAVWKANSVSAEHKLAMIKLAIQGQEDFSIDTYEVEQEEQPRSYQTVAYLRNKYPNDKFFFLIGQDQANSFHLWAKPELIAKDTQIVYYKRPNYIINRENIEHFNMMALEGPVIDVSSSEIRDLHCVGVKEEVLHYIEENNLYFIEKIRRYIKSKRYHHSLSVARTAYRLAKLHGLDVEKAYIAAILHDIAKGISDEDSLVLMKQFYPQYLGIGSYSYHQFLGELIVKRDFLILDEEILNAIKYHTTGKPNMTWLEKLVYVSDKVDPGRGYDSSYLIKAVEEDLDKGFVTILEANKNFLHRKREKIDNPLTEECFNWYLK